MAQERLSKSNNNAEDEQAQQVDTTAAEAQERKEGLDEDVDAILGEIDEVLEVNAEDFVRGFIQKGGQ